MPGIWNGQSLQSHFRHILSQTGINLMSFSCTRDSSDCAAASINVSGHKRNSQFIKHQTRSHLQPLLKNQLVRLFDGLVLSKFARLFKIGMDGPWPPPLTLSLLVVVAPPPPRKGFAMRAPKLRPLRPPAAEFWGIPRFCCDSLAASSRSLTA